jgi:hypothetical protein
MTTLREGALLFDRKLAMLPAVDSRRIAPAPGVRDDIITLLCGPYICSILPVVVSVLGVARLPVAADLTGDRALVPGSR